MKGFSRPGVLLTALVATGVAAQSSIPYIIQLPSEDFVWQWGGGNSAFEDRRGRPDFRINGSEQRFNCELTGEFKLGSRMSDFYELRAFEQSLNNTLYFIQDATETLNYYYRVNELDWGTLDCSIHDTEISEDKEQARVDRALERAERQRERRRRRDDNSDEN